jgi:hypothetical protein
MCNPELYLLNSMSSFRMYAHFKYTLDANLPGKSGVATRNGAQSVWAGAREQGLGTREQGLGNKD